MTHAYHDRLEGFDERQILYDGCAECEERGKDMLFFLNHSDDNTLRRAYARANKLSAAEDIGRISNAEHNILMILAILENRRMEMY